MLLKYSSFLQNEIKCFCKVTKIFKKNRLLEDILLILRGKKMFSVTFLIYMK